MRALGNQAINAAAFIGFIVLFPGFVVYHYGVAVEWIPPVLGGLFGGASIMLAGISSLAIAALFQGRLSQVPALEWLVVILLSYFFVWTFFAGAAIGGTYYAERAVDEALSTIAVWLAVYFVASRLTLDRTMLGMLWLGFFLICAMLVHAIVSHQSFIGPFLEFHGARDAQNESATYQSIGRSILVIAIVLNCSQDRIYKQIVLLLLTILALLAVGSRSHLMACVAVLGSVAALALLRKGNRVTGILLVVALLIVAQYLADLFFSTRANELLDLSQSTSWQERLRAQARAVEVLAQNPFLGDFGYHHFYRVPYVHNALSAWAEFGVVGFVGYVGVTVSALYMAAKRVVQRDASRMWRIAFQMNVVALLLGAATESIFLSVFPALAWGAAVNALRQDAATRFAAVSPSLALAVRSTRRHGPIPI